jgi:LPS sulfotransferase NodH
MNRRDLPASCVGAPRDMPARIPTRSFLIVAHQRSGSSSLARYLRLCTGARGVLEPFRSKYAKTHGFDISTPQKLTGFMDEYYVNHSFAKHLYNALDTKRNYAVYQHPAVARILFLYRRDLVASLLSSEVAKAAGHWREINPATVRRIRLESGKFAKDLCALRNMIEKNFRMVARSARICGSRVLTVAYEDLYSADKRAQRAIVRSILDFIGFDPQVWNAKRAFDKFISYGRKYSHSKIDVISNHTELRAKYHGIEPELGMSFLGRFKRAFLRQESGSVQIR